MEYYFKDGFATDQQVPETWFQVDVMLEHVYWYLRNFDYCYDSAALVISARDRVAEMCKIHGINSNPYASLEVSNA